MPSAPGSSVGSPPRCRRIQYSWNQPTWPISQIGGSTKCAGVPSICSSVSPSRSCISMLRASSSKSAREAAVGSVIGRGIVSRAGLTACVGRDMAQTVYEAFMATAAAAPDNVFLCAPPAAGRAYHPDGVELTYGQTREAVRGMREAYAAAGYGHGHRVALLLENRPEFFFHYLALNALGVGIVPINPDYRHDEMLYQMEHSEADLAVVLASRVQDLKTVARERAKPLPVVSAERWPAALPPPGPVPRSGEPGLDTETSLLYTSGTTGRPKGCILTNFYYLNAGAWYRDLGGRVQIEYGR